jgi:hypothetical protein
MASLPGPHKSLIQKASRGSGWGNGPWSTQTSAHLGTRAPAASIDSSLAWGLIGPSKRLHITGRNGSVNAGGLCTYAMNAHKERRPTPPAHTFVSVRVKTRVGRWVGRAKSHEKVTGGTAFELSQACRSL